METRSGITVTQEEVDSFFTDIRLAYAKPDRELTEFQKQVTIQAYECGYNKEQVSKKLGVSTKRMKTYYEEYKKAQDGKSNS
jgi:transposase